MTYSVPRLEEILSWARPHDSECERRFLKEFLDIIPGMKKDGFGNRFIRIGDSNVMWSCHVDTVAAKGGYQDIAHNPDNDMLHLAMGKAGMSLGADDGAGVWIMLHMIEHKRPGLYVFHRGEEAGCLGSSYVSREGTLLKGIDIAVAFDRAGYSDIITHQMGRRTASDEFAASMAAQLNDTLGFEYRADDGGVYTDTNEYASQVSECTNLSVGYFGQHGPRETLDLGHVVKLCGAMLALDASKLVASRDCTAEDEYESYYMGRYHKKRAPTRSEMDELIALIVEKPETAARLLAHHDYSADDFLWEAFDYEREAELERLEYEYEELPGYHPLVAH